MLVLILEPTPITKECIPYLSIPLLWKFKNNLVSVYLRQ
jgi:hypothetical protein